MEESSKEPNIKAEVSGATINDSSNIAADSASSSNEAEYSLDNGGCSSKWTRLITRMHAPVISGLLKISALSARNPRRTVSGVTLLSLALVAIGFLTNFDVDVDEDRLWTPKDSRVLQHSDWIDDRSGYPIEPRGIYLFMHDNTNNVLGKDQVQNVFEALDTLRNLPDYDRICAASTSNDRYGIRTCAISGVTTFWNDNATLFEQQVSSDEEAVAQLSAPNYPDGTPVVENSIFGLPQRDESGLLVHAKSYLVAVDLPNQEATEDFEEVALDAILALADRWDADPSIRLKLEVNAERSFGDEFERAILNDIPLIPIVFVIMSIFCCVFFFKNNKVKSRTMLGISAVVAVLLSIVSGFGLMFICGIPFTSMTQLLPFVVFGIGLDDAFIIAGAYDRTDKEKDAVERISETITEVGVSVTLTTVSTSLAFTLGTSSQIPAVFWLCLYAVPTVIFVFFYQVTFFVACLVLDTRRQEQNRRDCLTCITAIPDNNEGEAESNPQTEKESFIDQQMGRFAELLLKPAIQIPCVLIFMGLLGGCAYSASQLTQEFKFTDVLPDDSYLTDFQQARDANSARSIVTPYAYFRFVDQSNPEIQDQMEQYVADLLNLEAMIDLPERFWLQDFKVFVNRTGISDLDFDVQMDRFLDDPVNGELYGDHIVRDDTGSISTSRVRLFFDNLDIEDVSMQIETLEDQRDISASQPVSQGRDDFAFFTYDGPYNIWAFYKTTVREIILTTILGITSVTVITLLFVPHWTAAFFVMPLICILYVDLLGVMQWAGVHINAVSYISLVMSIGLMVDFLLHVLLRYYEAPGSRKEKVVITLKTMGSSVLVGGISTFLGTLPLAFSTSTIFNTVFIAFVGLVSLGCTHGLILLPILLAVLGPEEQVLSQQTRKSIKKQQSEKLVGASTTEVKVESEEDSPSSPPSA